MAIDAFLRGVAVLLAVMAMLAIVETLLPLSRKREWRRRHLLPNLQMAAVTLGLNFAFNAGAVLITGWLASRGFGVLAGAALPPLPTLAIDRCTCCRRCGECIASTTRIRSWT